MVFFLALVYELWGENQCELSLPRWTWSKEGLTVGLLVLGFAKQKQQNDLK